MKINPLLRLLLPVISLSYALLTGCAPYSDLRPGTVKSIDSSAVVERQEVAVPAIEAGPAPSADYVIGLNDVLYVNVSGHPELLVAPGGMNSKVQGSRVDGNGDIHVPLVGVVHVAGLTASQAGARICEAFKPYLLEPWVVVEIADYKSRPLYLLGQFRNSGAQYMDRPLTL